METELIKTKISAKSTEPRKISRNQTLSSQELRFERLSKKVASRFKKDKIASQEIKEAIKWVRKK